MPITLKWDSLTLTVPDQITGTPTAILSKASGIAQPGRVLVVMGPSGTFSGQHIVIQILQFAPVFCNHFLTHSLPGAGSGKTTYLNSLAGKQSATGELTLNGDSFKPEHARLGACLLR